METVLGAWIGFTSTCYVFDYYDSRPYCHKFNIIGGLVCGLLFLGIKSLLK